jgi:hypothetical protein
MLTSLIVAGPYPKWNTMSRPSSRGEVFLQRLFFKAFNENLESEVDFIDEFTLKEIPDKLREGCPDYGVLSRHFVWIIELKTEAGSHRKEQLPQYATLSAHHYQSLERRLLYLTPDMTKIGLEDSHGSVFRHIYWSEVLPLIEDVWSSSLHDEEKLLQKALERELTGLGTAYSSYTEKRDIIGQALKSAIDVQESGQQAAVDVNASGLEELMDLRIRIRDALGRTDETINVKPWIWYEASSGGRALTALGKEVGCELRLSRYL